MELLTLLSQLMIDEFEKRVMAIFDVPGAHLNSDIPEDKFVFIKLEDEFMDIMSKVNLEFIKYIQQEGKKKLLYLRVLKSLYGCIKYALLW